MNEQRIRELANTFAAQAFAVPVIGSALVTGDERYGACVAFIRAAWREATAEQRERDLTATEAEPEPRGSMPDEMWSALRERRSAELVIRATIRATKKGIARRIREGSE